MCPEAEGEAAGEATEGKRLSLDEILLVRGDLPRLPPPLLTGIQRRLWPLREAYHLKLFLATKDT